VPGCLYYFCGRNHAYTLGIFAAFYARAVAPAIRLIPYQRLGRVPSYGPGAYIFTDFDRMSPAAIKRLQLFVAPLGGDGRLVLNDPRRVLSRFDMLRRLHDEGLNDFAVYRLGDWEQVRRYPVFIRFESSHKETVTGLIEDRAGLRAAVGALESDPGFDDLMIVEFGNAPGADGRYRKYSAYRVGETIYPQHCFSSPGWWIKYDADDMGEAQRAEHLDYIATNPHEAPLREVFELAGIEYGRIDYCMIDGRVQTFEINTNPTVVQGRAYRAGDMSQYAKLHEDALLHLLEQAPDGPERPNPLFVETIGALTAKEVSDSMIDIIRKGWLAHEAGLAELLPA
jgi:hypothetical protein